MSSFVHFLLTCLAMLIGYITRTIGSLMARHNPSKPKKLLLFLGSGGHTTELLSIIKAFDFESRFHGTFVISSADQLSFHKLQDSQLKYQEVIRVVRARKVGQSYVTSVWTTLASLVHSFWICFRVRPDLLLCNGPGTSIPLCVASKLIGSKCIFIESFCRTRTLSLSAKMAAHIVDHVLVQYPQLVANHPDTPRLKYIGLLI
jgi:beta-1,4-N-acetylglucosaminyltransferase